MSNGGIIGVINTPTTSIASGVWTLNEVLLARSQNIWPVMGFSVDYLVVAGGGGGGYGTGSTSRGAGGGGAGGLLTASSYLISASTPYSLSVGQGGAAGTSGNGVNGGDSVFDTFTAVGGGGGGAYEKVATVEMAAIENFN